VNKSKHVSLIFYRRGTRTGARYKLDERIGESRYVDGKRDISNVSVGGAIEAFVTKHKLRGAFKVLATGHGREKLYAVRVSTRKIAISQVVFTQTAAEKAAAEKASRAVWAEAVTKYGAPRSSGADGKGRKIRKGRSSGSDASAIREQAAAIARAEGVARQKCPCCNDVAPPEECACCDGASSRASREFLGADSCPVPGTARAANKGGNVDGSKWCKPVPRRMAIYARDDFTCVYCLKTSTLVGTPKTLSLDHHVSRSEGGTDETSNLLTACVSCNATRKDYGNRIFFAAMREKGYDMSKVSARIRNALARQINMKLGRELLARRCAMFRAMRVQKVSSAA
jgi:hypothetical protein